MNRIKQIILSLSVTTLLLAAQRETPFTQQPTSNNLNAVKVNANIAAGIRPASLDEFWKPRPASVAHLILLRDSLVNEFQGNVYAWRKKFAIKVPNLECGYQVIGVAEQLCSDCTEGDFHPFAVDILQDKAYRQFCDLADVLHLPLAERSKQ